MKKLFFRALPFFFAPLLFSGELNSAGEFPLPPSAPRNDTSERGELVDEPEARRPPQEPSFQDISLVELAAGGAKFTIGEGSQTYRAARTLREFKINKYETTYALWFATRIQAERMGYVFENPGQEGSGGRRGKAPTDAGMREPVTMISWHDAIVWCNALSELQGRSPCYSRGGEILRDSTDAAACDLCECDFRADGWRLPTEAEWEYAARFSPGGMSRGDLASGLSSPEDDDRLVAWSFSNASGTRAVGTAGTVFLPDAPPKAGSGAANAAGVFDMSGNVTEYCWDWFANYGEQKEGERAAGPSYGERRVSRGGGWSVYTSFICAGDRYSFDPNEFYDYMGFRLATSR